METLLASMPNQHKLQAFGNNHLLGCILGGPSARRHQVQATAPCCEVKSPRMWIYEEDHHDSKYSFYKQYLPHL